MHDIETGAHKGRSYTVRFECVRDAGAGTVGDGLVPSRFEFMHDTTTGGDKPRPYSTLRKCFR